MISLHELHAMPGERMNWVDLGLDAAWFPELTFGDIYNTETLKQLDREDSLQVIRLVYVPDGRGSSTAMYRISHEGRPVAIIQQAGEGNREHFKRFLTNPRTYKYALAYLARFIEVPEEDFTDGDALHHEDVLLNFGGQSRAKQLALDEEPRHQGVLVLNLARITKGLGLADDYLVCLKVEAQPLTDYIRRGDFILRRVKLLTAVELDALNPRILETHRDMGYDRYYLYYPSVAPENTPVTRV